MSNFEERSPPVVNTQKTAMQQLKDFSRLKQNVLYHLSSALTSLKTADKFNAELKAVGVRRANGYLYAIINLRELRDDVIALRAPRAMIDAVNTETAEAKEKAKEIDNDRLRRAMFTSASEGRAGDFDSSSETLSSSSGTRYEPAPENILPISMAPTAKDNSARTQSSGEVAGEQVHSTSKQSIAHFSDSNWCPACYNSYGRNSIGLNCPGCGDALPSF